MAGRSRSSARTFTAGGRSPASPDSLPMNDVVHAPKRQQELFFAALNCPVRRRAGSSRPPLRGRSGLAPLAGGGTSPPDHPPARARPGNHARGYGFEGSEHTPSSEAEALAQALKPEEAGDRIGPYRLIEPLGEGGFGVVWWPNRSSRCGARCAQDHPPGHEQPRGHRPLRAGAQALAVMDHPGIARSSTRARRPSADRTLRWSWCAGCRSRSSATSIPSPAPAPGDVQASVLRRASRAPEGHHPP